MPVSADDFKAALGRFCSGVTVVTTVDGDGGDQAMTASAFTSLSLDPPLILVCVKKGGAMHGHLSAGAGFAVNVLGSDQETVSNRFAGWWKEGVSRWADLTIERAPVSGSAWIGGSLAQLDCTLHSALDGGDHTIFVGRVDAAQVDGTARDELAPLLYFAGRYRRLASD